MPSLGRQDVVRIQVAVHNALGVQCAAAAAMPRAMRRAVSRLNVVPGAYTSRVQVARLGGPARLPKAGVNQLQHQPFGPGGVRAHAAFHGNQVGVGAGADAGRISQCGRPSLVTAPLNSFTATAVSATLARCQPAR